MSAHDIRSRLEEAWCRVDPEADARKDSHSAVFALESFYRGLADEELPAAADGLIEWTQPSTPSWWRPLSGWGGGIVATGDHDDLAALAANHPNVKVWDLTAS